MKKISKIVVALCLVITSLFAMTAVTVSAGQTKYVSGAETGAVYLRKAPGSSSNYGTLKNGTVVDSIGYAIGNDGIEYNQVRVNGKVGWITTRYLADTYVNDNTYYVSAVVSGVKNSIYLWKYSTGDAYYMTIPVNASIAVNYGTAVNGRCMAYYNGNYGWVTTQYTRRIDQNNYIRSKVCGVKNSIYLWKYSFGDSYYTTIPLNAMLDVDYTSLRNGRYKAYYNGVSGWVTDIYVMMLRSPKAY